MSSSDHQLDLFDPEPECAVDVGGGQLCRRPCRNGAPRCPAHVAPVEPTAATCRYGTAELACPCVECSPWWEVNDPLA